MTGRPPLSLSWGAIFGGAVAALGTWLLLYVLGMALGLTAVNPANPDTLRSSGIFTGIWGLAAPLLALFVGGVVAGRGAGVTTKFGGALHGLVMWGLTLLAGIWFIAQVLSTILGGAATVGKTALQAGAGAVAGVAGQGGQLGAVAERFGLNADDALRPVNERLRAEGKPPVTAEQLQAAAKGVVQDAVQQGKLNRELLVSNLAQSTALSPKDADEVATRIENQFNEKKAQAGDALRGAAQTVQTGALKAADATGKAFWGIFAALSLGLISAVVGSIVGVSKRQRDWAVGRREVPWTSQREVYP